MIYIKYLRIMTLWMNITYCSHTAMEKAEHVFIILEQNSQGDYNNGIKNKNKSTHRLIYTTCHTTST